MTCALYSLISLQIQPRPSDCNSDSTWRHLHCPTKLTLLELPEQWSKGLRWLDAALHSCLCSRDRSVHVRKGPSDLADLFLSTSLACFPAAVQLIQCQDDYFLSFFFVLDVISTVTLVHPTVNSCTLRFGLWTFWPMFLWASWSSWGWSGHWLDLGQRQSSGQWRGNLMNFLRISKQVALLNPSPDIDPCGYLFVEDMSNDRVSGTAKIGTRTSRVVRVLRHCVLLPLSSQRVELPFDRWQADPNH